MRTECFLFVGTGREPPRISFGEEQLGRRKKGVMWRGARPAVLQDVNFGTTKGHAQVCPIKTFRSCTGGWFMNDQFAGRRNYGSFSRSAFVYYYYGFRPVTELRNSSLYDAGLINNENYFLITMYEVRSDRLLCKLNELCLVECSRTDNQGFLSPWL
ncbi:hypothetical protein GWI33_018899 [Rhynchophorus ferrugineus]|uniref:Uncharacterized protein n=1 Tax=Rhynchophorus ferrugineus TaxID=354439 RepID=A0A834HSH5_RHYFE|nr:hypothetical protein GWI33_018899 [Rhynchophorus ferrugineus]